MRKIYLLLFCIAVSYTALCQGGIIDSFKAQLARAATNEEKVEKLGLLSRTLINTSIPESDKYALQMMEVAEISRDRKLIVKALLTNGERYSYLAGRKDNMEKAIRYYTQGLELARKNKLDEQMISAYLYLSEISRYGVDIEKALNYCNQAYSYTATIKNDSLSARVHMEYGFVYVLKNEKLLALKSLMTAIRIAEDLKNNTLLRSGYNKLSSFYSGIEDYDKAIDYQVKAMQKLDFIKTTQAPYSRVQDLTSIGDLYGAKKNYEMATTYYERSLKLADSLKYEPIKSLVYRSIINNFTAANEPQKALNYLNQHPNFKAFFEKINYGFFIDLSYGYIYTQTANYDSAKYYYNKAAPFFENDANSGYKFYYYYQLGLMYKKTKEYDRSLEYFIKAKLIAEKVGELSTMSSVIVELDSLYQAKADYKQAFYYASLNHTYKDSLDKLGKEKDLLQIEVADEQQRQERSDKEKADKKRKRDNIQYLLITIGIAGMFILMVMLGMFKVSATTIKMIGFFTFLMFFEFIFLIFKKNIYGFTNGEPWKDLGFMILLAAILLPFHHWLEHRVIHYLTSHNRLTASGKGLMDKLLKMKTTVSKKKIG